MGTVRGAGFLYTARSLELQSHSFRDPLRCPTLERLEQFRNSGLFFYHLIAAFVIVVNFVVQFFCGGINLGVVRVGRLHPVIAFASLKP